MYNTIKTVREYIQKKKDEEARYYQGALDSLALLENQLKTESTENGPDPKTTEDSKPKRSKKKGE